NLRATAIGKLRKKTPMNITEEEVRAQKKENENIKQEQHEVRFAEDQERREKQAKKHKRKRCTTKSRADV
ncbi:hypothetical protein, partial [Klebsiella pneumoniae]|uniref:hypothetical protein n=1 Tax=Klebsiella pneumoniae TaxID=573 RepID=UPI003B58F788